MKSLEEIKDTCAKSFGYKDNEDLIGHLNPAWINEQIDLVAKRYAEQCIDTQQDLMMQVQDLIFDIDDGLVRPMDIDFGTIRTLITRILEIKNELR